VPTTPPAHPPTLLPPDDPQREALHDEVHARPPARVRLPALVVYVAVLNDAVSRADELAHLQRLPGQKGLRAQDVAGNFLRMRLPGCTLKWERHSEFTRYSIVQALPEPALALLRAAPGRDGDGAIEPDLLSAPALDPQWIAAAPGRTIAAIELALVPDALADPQAVLESARRWFGGRATVASLMGGGHSLAVTDFRLLGHGFERMLVIAPPDTSPTRAGRISQRLLELETYRLMALRGLPAAKALAPVLGEAESALADITARLEGKAASDQDLLDRLTALAARVERATAENGYRFSATAAYDALVRQRIAELREKPIPGTQTIGEFMQRRLSPAMATVASTAQRLAALSQRIERAGALLRTRVDIATEAQNQQLLAKLTRGQELQLQLQSTVEGLSIAAISYYVVGLLYYASKAAKTAGLPIDPELTAGASIPVVLWLVWRTVRRIHERLARTP
jgi:uncharacterized membrane-anchored protein